MVGHLSLDDDNGLLIRIVLSHLQLHIGSSTIWWFTFKIKAVIDVEHFWLPKPPRRNDRAIMDLAMQKNFTAQQLKELNSCQIYMQVFWISDISSANGKHLLPSALKGERNSTRCSTLLWPYSDRPMQWSAWMTFIQHVSQGYNLLNPLGPWEQKPHQDWQWFYDLHADKLDYLENQNQTAVLHSRQNTNRITCRSQNIYGAPIEVDFPTLAQQATFFPTTTKARHTLILITGKVPITFQLNQNLQWILFGMRQESRQHLKIHLSFTQSLKDQCDQLTEEIQEKSLLSCSDGAYCSSTHHSHHGWVFASDGHPALLSSYRSELGGILAALYIIHRICEYYLLSQGAAILYCDNKGAVHKAFTTNPKGITPYLTTDYDLLGIIHSLVSILPITVIGYWVKECYTGTH
jgi:hypothetical protein